MQQELVCKQVDFFQINKFIVLTQNKRIYIYINYNNFNRNN